MQSLGISTLKIFKANFFQKVRAFHKTAFSNKYLLMTNVGISISLSAVGDIVEQQYEIFKGELEEYNPKRTRHMSACGLTVGILCHHWYKFIDKRMPGRAFSLVIKKTLVDQIICSPICLSAFFVTLALLERSTIEELKEEIKHKAIRLYTAEWVIWPPAQIINFSILPTKYRVLYDNTISLAYDVYTSKVINDKSHLTE